MACFDHNSSLFVGRRYIYSYHHDQRPRLRYNGCQSSTDHLGSYRQFDVRDSTSTKHHAFFFHMDTWTERGNFPSTAIPTSSSPAANTASASSTSIVPALVGAITFYSTSVPVTIQPQPTMFITLPPTMTPVPKVTVSKGTPKTSTCTSGCGSRECGIFGCTPDCGIFGCDGGCGIFGCGGGCGVFGCTADCPLDLCGGLSCVLGECGDGVTSTSGSPGDDEDEDCDDPSTVSACTYIVSSYSTSPMTTYSTVTKTHCETFTECSTSDSATTTTETTSESSDTAEATVSLYDLAYPSEGDAALAAMATSIQSARFAWDKTRYSGLTVPPSTSTSTTTITTTVPQAPSTTTEIVVVTPTCDCEFWDEGWGYTFEIYNIAYWSTDGGAGLKTQEYGCGAVTGWDWYDATSTSYAYLYFNIDFFFKSGCIERAIVSAGGPKISCVGGGLGRRRAENKRDDLTIGPVAPAYSAEQVAAFKEVYANSTATHDPYVPMDWSGDNSTAVQPNVGTKMVFVKVYVGSEDET